MPPLLFMLALASADQRALQLRAETDPWVGSDKTLHFTLAGLITGAGYAAGAEIGGVPVRLIFGATFGLGAAAVKELADLAGLGHPSIRDFTWSAGGVIVGLLVAWVIDRAFSTPEVPIYVRAQ